MEPLKVGVVGVGHLGRHHARLYRQLDGVELVGVVDRDAERARSIAEEFGCAVYDDISGLAREVQAASVAVPTAQHHVVAPPLLEHGVDVLIEKPLARTLDEADVILDASERSGRLVMVGHTERFNPAVKALAAAVSAPRFFEIHRLAEFSARSTDIDVVRDLMIHDLDLLLHLDGGEPTSVDAVGVAALTDKIDIANARIRLTSGCVANLTASRISLEPLRRIRVFQARTYLSCDTGKRSVERCRLALSPDGAPRIDYERLAVEDEEPLANELAAFVGSVRTRTTPAVDGRQGRRALELARRVSDAIEAAAADR